MRMITRKYRNEMNKLNSFEYSISIFKLKITNNEKEEEKNILRFAEY